MTKNETINEYLNLNKVMDKILGDVKVSFNRELKSIIGITQTIIDRCYVDFENNKENVTLSLNIDEPFLINLLTNREFENPFEDTGSKVFVKLASVDLVGGYVEVVKTKYADLLNEILDSINQEISGIENERKVIMEKSKGFWWRLFHNQYNKALETMDLAISKINDIKKIITEEKRLFNDTIENGVIKTFIEESSAGLGIMNIKTLYVDEGEVDG